MRGVIIATSDGIGTARAHRWSFCGDCTCLPCRLRRRAARRPGPRARYPETRCQASRRWSSRSSVWDWTTSSRWRRQTRGSARPSTARAAPCATACPPWAASAPLLKCARDRRGPQGEFIAAGSIGRVALSPLLGSRATPVSRSFPPMPRSSFGVCRFRSSARGWSKRSPTRRCWPSRIPFDRNRDGVSGRAAIVTDRASGERRVGRFGWKAQHATLLAFSADAYRNEMGITNDLFSTGGRGRRSRTSACACAIRIPIPRTSGIHAPAAAASTTSRAS